MTIATPGSTAHTAVTPGSTVARPSATPVAGSWPLPDRRVLPHRVSAAVLAVVLGATAAFTALTRVNYLHEEQRLTRVLTELTGDALGVAPVDLERRLGVALSAAAHAPHPAAVYRSSIAASLAPTGPFVRTTLVRLRKGTVDVLLLMGAKPLDAPTGTAATALYRQAARTPLLVTTRVVRGHEQRLGYALSAPTAGGTLVAYATQALPAGRRITVPASSPDAGFDFAIYFGRRIDTSALIETNAASLPLSGTVSTVTVPFGTSVLTVVATPKGPLVGRLAAVAPWFILGVGIVLALGMLLVTESLVRRRRHAEVLAAENRRLYDEQKQVALTLQRSLLPRSLPSCDGVQLAARYLPGTQGIDVGGDWYDVVRTGSHQLFFTVGDVAGRGLEAAALMSRLRNAINILALEADEPADVLTRLSRFVDVAREGHFATALCGRLDAASGTLSLANAGHPRPLLIGPHGSDYLGVAPGPPIGLGHEPYLGVDHALHAGETLLAFTDGLVERRSEPLNTGMERLRRAAAPGRSLERLLDDVLADLVPGGAADDIALLGVSRCG